MKKSPWPVFVPLAVLLLLIAALAAVLKSGPTSFARHVGDPAPATALPMPGGGPVVFSTSVWQGKPYLVSFFASWCAPCRAEHAMLMELAKKERVPIVGIAVKDRAQAIAAFLGKDGNPYTVLAEDLSGRAAIDWGITGLPETFLIDGQGVIRFHESGPLTEAVVARDLLPMWRSLQP